MDANLPNYLIKLNINEVRSNIIFDKPLFPNSSLNRIANTTLLFPYSLIRQNRGIRGKWCCVIHSIKGTIGK